MGAAARLMGALLAVFALAGPARAQAPAPDAHFGFRIGADRELAGPDAIERYFERVSAASDRVRLVDVGRTTEGRRTIAAIVSSSDNIKALEQIRAANRRLADPRTLPPEEARALTASHKAVVTIGGGIHPSEVGATQALNELLYWLATSTEPPALTALENLVIIIVPSLNPDGHQLVVDWYLKHKGTPFEGSPMPWLYHKYAGHDINRDAFMMNLAESRNLARFFYSEWHPQIFLTMHEMASNGARFFVPPNVDPIDLNHDALIWRTAGLLGGAMALELQRDGRRGVLSNAMFDYYWPGYEDSAPLGHNVVCLLTEAAGVQVASPLTIAPADLRGGFKGLREYRPQINFPDPWPGGAWTLRNIVDYNLSAIRGLLRAAAAYRAPIVENFYAMGRNAIDAGRRGGPFAFLIPSDQHDPHAAAKLEELLLQGAIEIHRAIEPFRADGEPYPEGTDIILMAQPFRAYVKTLLERQQYPGRRRADGSAERPYDVTGWMLPEQMGVRVITIERSFEPPPMTRLTRVSVPPADVWGERRPGFYVMESKGNAAALAANRLTAAGAALAWLTEPLEANGYRYAVGSLVVPYARPLEPVVQRIASELGMRVDGVRGKPPASLRTIGRARVALYRPWFENTDEGWTRWLLDTYGFRYMSLNDAQVRSGNLRAYCDAVILPSAPPEKLVAGQPEGSVPPEYAGGLGTAGVAALKEFVEAGGTLIALDQAGRLVIDMLNLPLKDVADEASSEVFGPGSILRLDVDQSHPLAYGMPDRTAAFFAFSSAFELKPRANAASGTGIRTAARYAATDLLVSGWLEGGQAIAGRAAVVEAQSGAGRAILLGFPTQHRGQSHATFRLLFNAVLSASDK
jgi:hypothetical protein